jgi:tape measure domain-containing protein
MARDLKLTATLTNGVSKEIDKIIKDLERMGKAASSQAANRASEADKASKRVVDSEEKVLRERIRIQRASAALADRQEREAANRMKRANAGSLREERDFAESTLRIERRAAIAEASIIENRFDRRISIERVRHAQILQDLKGNSRAIEAEIRRSTAVQNRIRMDKENLPNTPFQRLLGQVGASQSMMGTAAAIGGVAAGATAAAAAIYTVTRAVGGVTEAGYRLNGVQRALAFAAGGAKEGAKEFAYLTAESKRLGFSVTESAQGFAMLSAAAKGTALEGKGARDIFSSVSEAAVTLGLTSYQTSGALNAIQQMISKGTVQSEELRGQLGERLPGAFQIAARSMGTTTQGLGKMLEQGKVLAEDFLPKFAAELHKTFGEAAEDASKRGQAAINKLNSRVSLLVGTIGQDLVTAFGVAANGINIYLDALGTLGNISQEAQKSAQAQIFGMNGTAMAATDAASKLDEQRKKVLALAAAQDKMNTDAAKATSEGREGSAKAAYESQAEAQKKAEEEAATEAKRWADQKVEVENDRLARVREKRAEARDRERQEAIDEAAADAERTEAVYSLRAQVASAQADAMTDQFARERKIADAHFSELREHHAGNESALSEITRLESEKRKQIDKAEKDARIALSLNFVSAIGNLLAVLGRKNKALARAAQIVNIGEAIANTAVGVTKALASAPPPWNFIQAATVAASGAAQVATISMQKYARGTDYAPGGMALVGEQGPELIHLPKGSRVDKASDTSRSMGGNIHNGPVNITVNLPSSVTPTEAKKIGAAVGEGYREKLREFRQMSEDADYILGPRR